MYETYLSHHGIKERTEVRKEGTANDAVSFFFANFLIVN